jgi:hypothetical protein
MEHELFKRADLIVNDSHGIYIPQVFASMVDHSKFPDITPEEWNILLEGPTNEDYWDTWLYNVLDSVSIDGGMIYQDGDVWIVYEWNDE